MSSILAEDDFYESWALVFCIPNLQVVSKNTVLWL
jgi:hypothetical protein